MDALTQSGTRLTRGFFFNYQRFVDACIRICHNVCMPFKSEKQRRFLWLKHPDIARRWAHDYPQKKKLPMYAHDSDSKEKEAALAKLMLGVRNINNLNNTVGYAKTAGISKKANSEQRYIEIPHSEHPTYAGEEREQGEQKDLDSDNTLPDRNRGEGTEARDKKPKENAINALLQKISMQVSEAVRQKHENALAAQEGRPPVQVPRNSGLKPYPRAQAGIPLPMGMQQQPAQAQPQQQQAQQPKSATSAPPVGKGGNPSASPIQHYGAIAKNNDLTGNSSFATAKTLSPKISAALNKKLAVFDSLGKTSARRVLVQEKIAVWTKAFAGLPSYALAATVPMLSHYGKKYMGGFTPSTEPQVK